MTSTTEPARPMLAMLHLRTRRPHDPTFQVALDALNAPTIRVAEHLGWDVVPVASAEVDPTVTADLVDRADAVVLMGGEDVDPAFYGGPSTYPGSGHHEPDADRAHIDAVHRCLEAGTPLLGICRGLQVLNVALGGSLVPHLTSPQLHRAAGDDHFVRTRVTVTHQGLGASVDASQDVRCAHHQAVDRLGDGLVVAARAADGVIEALVHETAPITAVQWHPEHAETADGQLGALLRRLTEQAPVVRPA
ncbi:gamma-glutamyl-gamma-aminobutyrate hydrolase family protein [Aeromicrobium choanae]|nr:gamma-glutamyl-gamma-aminobutyrate hydrolase family protein [Aeromicrobium choanae]